MRVKYFEKKSQLQFRVRVDKNKPKFGVEDRLRAFANKDINEVYTELLTSPEGLAKRKANTLLAKYGYNEVVREKRKFWPVRLVKTFYNPLILLLLLLALISWLSSDTRTTIIIAIMISISVFLRFFQETQAYNAAKTLRAMVKTTCTVIRNNAEMEISLSRVVPGDIIQLSAGDIVPADARIITSKDLFVNQALLTGESLPSEKHADIPLEKSALELSNLCFMGTTVDSGTARAVVVATGNRTYFGGLAKDIVGMRVETGFDKGVNQFTWLMIWFMLVMTPLVFLINWYSKGNWWEAFLFAVSVAVGLTPEMLPAIVTVNLSKGAIMMSKKKVIVKRLSSIQNFGAMDVLCTDKTGTLTQNKVVLIKNINIEGKEDDLVLQYAYLNSLYQTGFKNLLDEAILKHNQAGALENFSKKYQKIDELPFDFLRRRLSVVVGTKSNDHLLVCKGATEELLAICKSYELGGEARAIKKADAEKIKAMSEELSRDGFRVIAVAYRNLDKKQLRYSKADEENLIFLGFMTFLDPPKDSAAAAIKRLTKNNVSIKVLTGDNELVTKKICKEVGVPNEGVVLGSQIEQMTDAELAKTVETSSIFAKLSPDHKRRVVLALQKNNHVVGFLGDGINDAPGLRAADVGISVNTATDIAKESADIILLEMSLLVLAEGVIEGRKVFGNIIKYIKMGASSNFGNMFSVLGASIFLPFLPMTPLQLITNNLLYDMSQTAIPTDKVDEEYLEKPRQWNIKDIRRFMLCIGPVSSVFDYVTFVVMLFVFHASRMPALLQTGWFVESLLTQTLIVHVIRSRKIPFLQTISSRFLLFTTAAIMAIGIYLVSSPISGALGFVRLPKLYWPLLILILLSYITLTQLIKNWYIKKFGYN